MTKAAAPAVLIVDDHPLFRLGLASALSARGYVSIAVSDGSVTSAADLVPSGAGDGPWVAILDVRLGAVDGLELCRRLRALVNPPVVVMLSTFDDPAVLQAAREAGAFAFLTKEADAAQIAEAIGAGLAGHAARIREQRIPVLTRREAEVLRLLQAGCDTKTIAARLGIAPATAKDHLENLYVKLEVTDRLNAVRRATELGLHEFPGDT